MVDVDSAQFRVLRRKTPSELATLWRNRSTLSPDIVTALQVVLAEKGIESETAEESVDATQRTSGAAVEKAEKKLFNWLIFPRNGDTLQPSNVSEVVQWLKEGIVSLDDLCSSQEEPQARKLPIRESLGRKELDVRALFDPAGAKSRTYASIGIVLVAIPAAITIYFWNAVPVYTAAGFGTLVGVVLAIATPIAFVLGGIPAVILGFFVAASSGNQISWIAASVGPPIGVLIAAAAGFVGGLLAGGIPGFAIGWLVGRLTAPLLR